jgi:hypothetical protein
MDSSNLTRVFVLTCDNGGYSRFVGVFRTLDAAKALAEELHSQEEKTWKSYSYIEDTWYLEDEVETFIVFTHEL